MIDRAVLSWSGGKDAALALHELAGSGGEGGSGDVGGAPEIAVERLLTTVSAATDRVTMHGVRPELVERQAAAAGLPLDVLELPADPSNEEYEAAMTGQLREYADRGIDRAVFADVFLSDVRAYREENLSDTPLSGYWPLWGRDTEDLVEELLAAGFRATVVCVDGSALDRSFVGRDLDRDCLADLPEGVDPCGENGEFHTFVRDCPAFEAPVHVETGERVTRTVAGSEFHYCDLLPAE
ncbi:ATP-binding protein [Halobacteriales archaeon QS_8_69_26]|nr:MAG: ATP-binding protein [Halobacteriales archaeon QS_8_69_26]